ncbi:MAG: TadE/TadG family type IV pilus assembly protein [Pyrinomonadaceae bacterium]
MWQNLIKKISCFKRNDRGVQLVELAIVLPIFVVLFAAVAEFGRYFYEYTTLAKGSRAAVRYLVTESVSGCADLPAKNLVVYGNLAGTGAPIISGLALANVQITRQNAAGAPTGGVPTTITIKIINFQHSSIFDLAKVANSSAFLDIDVKPSVTMRYLLTVSPIGTC